MQPDPKRMHVIVPSAPPFDFDESVAQKAVNNYVETIKPAMLTLFNFVGSDCFSDGGGWVFPAKWLRLNCGYDLFKRGVITSEFYKNHLADSQALTFDKYLAVLLYMDLDPGKDGKKHDDSYVQFSRDVAGVLLNDFTAWLQSRLNDTYSRMEALEKAYMFYMATEQRLQRHRAKLERAPFNLRAQQPSVPD